ncbi:glucokinase [Pyruvatibacter mobilis]|uniref:glucokinase n=1 Tax=Pyruvatibacter mobilis TaxID=1712261 RepID=UPI003C7B2FC2
MPTPHDLPVLVADIGGTHARFALTQPGASRPDEPMVLMTALYPTLEAALDTFLEQAGHPALGGAALCAAGPVQGTGDECHIAMTNLPWVVSARAVIAATGCPRISIVNDFTAAALSLPHLDADDLVQIGGATADDDAPRGILGPGTGLGVSGLIPDGRGGFVPLSGEGGHVSLAPGNEREISLLFQLMQTHGHVSAERVLCGPGMEELYGALGALDGSPEIGRPTAADIARMAADGSSPLAREVVEVFTGLLGSVAGDLALTLGARGGIYLAGGILPRWGDLLNHRLLRYRFEAKGRFKPYLAEIPIYLITVRDIALIGLTALARRS